MRNSEANETKQGIHNRELIARALASSEKAQSRNEYYTVDEVLHDLVKVLQKARDKIRS